MSHKYYKLIAKEKGESALVPIDQLDYDNKCTIVLKIYGIAVCDLECSISNKIDDAIMFKHEILNNVSTSTASIIDYPISFLRLNVTELSIGSTVTLELRHNNK